MLRHASILSQVIDLINRNIFKSCFRIWYGVLQKRLYELESIHLHVVLSACSSQKLKINQKRLKLMPGQNQTSGHERGPE